MGNQYSNSSGSRLVYQSQKWSLSNAEFQPPMGRQPQLTSTAVASSQYWQQSLRILENVPGKPYLIYSTRMPILEAEMYIIESSKCAEFDIDMFKNGNKNKYDQGANNETEQGLIYRQRKISHQNIVNIYEYTKKQTSLGCATCTSGYRIITQRIKYRLSEISGQPSQLTLPEMIYVFHEALCGYKQISRYGRLCYPKSQMIGIKDNGDVKVWVNEIWAENGYRQARSQKQSIEALWNCIKILAVGQNTRKNLIQFNKCLYRIDGLKFENVIPMIRTTFSKQIIQGRFAIQNRVKNIENYRKQNLQTTNYNMNFKNSYPTRTVNFPYNNMKNINKNNQKQDRIQNWNGQGVRPRAQSEKIKKTEPFYPINATTPNSVQSNNTLANSYAFRQNNSTAVNNVKYVDDSVNRYYSHSLVQKPKSVFPYNTIQQASPVKLYQYEYKPTKINNSISQVANQQNNNNNPIILPNFPNLTNYRGGQAVTNIGMGLGAVPYVSNTVNKTNYAQHKIQGSTSTPLNQSDNRISLSNSNMMRMEKKNEYTPSSSQKQRQRKQISNSNGNSRHNTISNSNHSTPPHIHIPKLQQSSPGPILQGYTPPHYQTQSIQHSVQSQYNKSIANKGFQQPCQGHQGNAQFISQIPAKPLSVQPSGNNYVHVYNQVNVTHPSNLQNIHYNIDYAHNPSMEKVKDIPYHIHINPSLNINHNINNNINNHGNIHNNQENMGNFNTKTQKILPPNQTASSSPNPNDSYVGYKGMIKAQHQPQSPPSASNPSYGSISSQLPHSQPQPGLHYAHPASYMQPKQEINQPKGVPYPELHLNLKSITDRQEKPHSFDSYAYCYNIMGSTERPVSIHPHSSLDNTRVENSYQNHNEKNAFDYKDYKERETMDDRQSYPNHYRNQANNNNKQKESMQMYQLRQNIMGKNYIYQSPVKSKHTKNKLSFNSSGNKTNSDVHYRHSEEEQLEQEQSDSKKVAQQFKYYLRSIQKSPQRSPRSPSSQNSQPNDITAPIHAGNRQLMYQMDTGTIPQRWDQQQSLSQNY